MTTPTYRFQRRIAQHHIESVVAGIASPSGSWDIPQMQRDLRDADHVATAWSGPDLIGFAAATAEGENVSLSWLFVRPDQQRKGVGTKLVTNVLARFRKAYCVHIVANQAAVPFYRNCGFEPAPHVVPMMKKLEQ